MLADAGVVGGGRCNKAVVGGEAWTEVGAAAVVGVNSVETEAVEVVCCPRAVALTLVTPPLVVASATPTPRTTTAREDAATSWWSRRRWRAAAIRAWTLARASAFGPGGVGSSRCSNITLLEVAKGRAQSSEASAGMLLDTAHRAPQRRRHGRLGQVCEIAKSHDFALASRERSQHSPNVDPFNTARLSLGWGRV
jgi:hypothetical protein